MDQVKDAWQRKSRSGWSPEQRVKIDYVAFDPLDRDAEECRTAIARLHANPEQRVYFTTLPLCARNMTRELFHVVVMCNVLHEILPSNWSDLFGPQGKITRLLHADGFVLLVEVQQLPYGRARVLIIRVSSFRIRYRAVEKTVFESKRLEHRRDSQHAAAKDGWPESTFNFQTFGQKDSRMSPLPERFDRSARYCTGLCIRGLRGDRSDYRSGRLHGFWVQKQIRQCEPCDHLTDDPKGADPKGLGPIRRGQTLLSDILLKIAWGRSEEPIRKGHAVKIGKNRSGFLKGTGSFLGTGQKSEGRAGNRAKLGA